MSPETGTKVGQDHITEGGELGEAMAVNDGDVVLAPKAPLRSTLRIRYVYLNVMAGPRRNWRFQNHPDHD